MPDFIFRLRSWAAAISMAPRLGPGSRARVMGGHAVVAVAAIVAAVVDFDV